MNMQSSNAELDILKQKDIERIKRLSEDLVKNKKSKTATDFAIQSNLISYLRHRIQLAEAIIANNQDSILTAKQCLELSQHVLEYLKHRQFIIPFIKESQRLLFLAEQTKSSDEMKNVINDFHKINEEYMQLANKFISSKNANLKDYLRINKKLNNLFTAYNSLIETLNNTTEIESLKTLRSTIDETIFQTEDKFQKLNMKTDMHNTYAELVALKSEILAAADFNEHDFNMKFEELTECLLKANEIHFERINRPQGIVDTKYAAIFAGLNKLITDASYRENRQNLQTSILALRDFAQPFATGGKKALEADFKKALTLFNAIRSFSDKLGDDIQEDNLQQQISQSILLGEIVRKSYDPHNTKGTKPFTIENKKPFSITFAQHPKKEISHSATFNPNESHLKK